MTMTCEELTEQLPDYFEGTLTVEIHEKLSLHLCCCQTCVVVVQQYEVVIRLSRALPKDDKMPDSVAARLRARFRFE